MNRAPIFADPASRYKLPAPHTPHDSPTPAGLSADELPTSDQLSSLVDCLLGAAEDLGAGGDLVPPADYLPSGSGSESFASDERDLRQLSAKLGRMDQTQPSSSEVVSEAVPWTLLRSGEVRLLSLAAALRASRGLPPWHPAPTSPAAPLEFGEEESGEAAQTADAGESEGCDEGGTAAREAGWLPAEEPGSSKGDRGKNGAARATRGLSASRVMKKATSLPSSSAGKPRRLGAIKGEPPIKPCVFCQPRSDVPSDG